MSASSIFAEVVCVAAVLAGGAWVVWQMKLGRDTAVSDGTWQSPWGEIVEVPDAAKVAGGVAEGRSAGLAQDEAIARSHGRGV